MKLFKASGATVHLSSSLTNPRNNGWMDECMDGWIDGWMDGIVSYTVHCSMTTYKQLEQDVVQEVISPIWDSATYMYHLYMY